MDFGDVEFLAGRVAGFDEGDLAGEDSVVRELGLRQRHGTASVDVLLETINISRRVSRLPCSSQLFA